jgi:hypothetical protein
MVLKKYYAIVTVIDYKAKAKKIGIHSTEFLLCAVNQDINFLVSVNK